MKKLLFILLFFINSLSIGFASPNNNGSYIMEESKKLAFVNTLEVDFEQNQNSENLEDISNISEPKENNPPNKKIIKNLEYYLLAGFVLLAGILYFTMLRKKAPQK